MTAVYELEEELFSLLKPKLLDDYLGLEELANDFSAALILRYFRDEGVSVEPGVSYSFSELESRLKIEPRHKRMFTFFIHVLTTRGLAQQAGDTLEFVGYKDADSLLKKIVGLYPAFGLFFTFLDGCAKKYPLVLTGKMPAAHVLFPAGDSAMLEKIYANTPKVGYEELYLELLKDVLLEKMGATHSVVVEVGAGQGILTDVVVPYLAGRSSEYVFSDIGGSFLKQAEKKYPEMRYPFIHYKEYDISKNPLDQGWNKEAADFVIGFNVVHATSNIATTLEETAKIVKPGGWMFFVENVKQQFWIDMIYGVTEGWWCFDDGIRTISPLLTCDQWLQVARSANFKSFELIPQKSEVRKKTDSALLMIQK